jgi:hypothetical protein
MHQNVKEDVTRWENEDKKETYHLALVWRGCSYTCFKKFIRFQKRKNRNPK